MPIHYEKYWLSKIISVQAIVSADYVKGVYPASRNHIHRDAWELILCSKGATQLVKDDDLITLRQNELVLIQPGVSHDLSITEPDTKTFILSFTCSNDNYLLSLQNSILMAGQPILDLAEAMIRELKDTFIPHTEQLHLFRFIPNANSPLGAEQMICCYLEQFLILLLRDATMEKGSVVSSHRFHKAFQTYLTDQVTTYIQKNLSGHLTVESIAEHFHYSRARLSALYKEATGIGINEAISNARIQAAKRMLHENEKSIAQISEELGFSSPQYFSYKFTKITGTPPSQYNQKYKRKSKIR